MRLMISRLMILTSLLFSPFVHAGLFNSSVESTVNAAANALMASHHVPGMAVIVYVEGKPSIYYFGYANKESKSPVNEKTIFEIGGITHLMTSLLVAQEIDFARMNLKNPIKKYIHQLPDSLDELTLADVATQTAGLPSHLPATIQSASGLMDYLSSFKDNSDVGNDWQPSLASDVLLGTALQETTKKDYDWLYFHHIAGLLDMQHLGVVMPDKYKINLAQGYAAGMPAPSISDGFFLSVNGVRLSVIDMQKFLAAAIGLPGTPERIFYPMRMTQSVYVKLPGRMQGLGWQIYSLSSGRSSIINQPVLTASRLPVAEISEQPLFDGDMLMDKVGVTSGFGAYIAVIPNKNAGIAILANQSLPQDVIAKVGREILLGLV